MDILHLDGHGVSFRRLDRHLSTVHRHGVLVREEK